MQIRLDDFMGSRICMRKIARKLYALRRVLLKRKRKRKTVSVLRFRLGKIYASSVYAGRRARFQAEQRKTELFETGR